MVCVYELCWCTIFYGVELSNSLYTIYGARDPSLLIAYIYTNTIPTAFVEADLPLSTIRVPLPKNGSLSGR